MNKIQEAELKRIDAENRKTALNIIEMAGPLREMLDRHLRPWWKFWK